MGRSTTANRKRKDIGLIVLSAIDLVTGVLSLVFAAFAVQVIAIMASGLTLMKAVKVAVQSEKAAIFMKPIAVTAIRQLTRSEKMKAFFSKLKQNLKNNPITLVTVIVELVVCGCLGYTLIDFFDRFAWAIGWKLYAVAFGGAGVIYAILLGLTIYLGHDNIIFAFVRKAVKFLGGEKASDALNEAIEEAQKALEDLERKEAEEKAEQARIEEEQAKKAEEADAKAKREQ